MDLKTAAQIVYGNNPATPTVNFQAARVLDTRSALRRRFEDAGRSTASICPDCNGSGEGMFSGAICTACKGRGE